MQGIPQVKEKKEMVEIHCETIYEEEKRPVLKLRRTKFHLYVGIYFAYLNILCSKIHIDLQDCSSTGFQTPKNSQKNSYLTITIAPWILIPVQVLWHILSILTSKSLIWKHFFPASFIYISWLFLTYRFCNYNPSELFQHWDFWFVFFKKYSLP